MQVMGYLLVLNVLVRQTRYTHTLAKPRAAPFLQDHSSLSVHTNCIVKVMREYLLRRPGIAGAARDHRNASRRGGGRARRVATKRPPPGRDLVGRPRIWSTSRSSTACAANFFMSAIAHELLRKGSHPTDDLVSRQSWKSSAWYRPPACGQY